MTADRQRWDGARACAELLAWYDAQRRDLPWRTRPGEAAGDKRPGEAGDKRPGEAAGDKRPGEAAGDKRPGEAAGDKRPGEAAGQRRLGGAADPYRIWLSEIMCQQTTVVTATPYFNAFVERWPTLDALARAEVDEVLHAWQGLGYYHRARNLHACARRVMAEHGGKFPDDEAGLRALPGIGPYTAAAVAAIAFGRPCLPVDGNVERVTARLFAVLEPLPGAKAVLRRLAARLTSEHRPGDVAQAVMELGATICKPRRPLCDRCPWSNRCRAHERNIAAQLPKRVAKTARPLRHGVAFVVSNAEGAWLLRRRPDDGLLGGMMEFPSTPWREKSWTLDQARKHAPTAARWTAVGVVRHVFSHFTLELTVAVGRTRARKLNGLWCAPERLGDHALPSLMKKVAAVATSGRSR